MNIKRLIPCFLLISPLLLGSCENEQITDMERQGTELPEGKYPLTFTAVQAIPEETPQTRVSESENGMSSHWDGGEVINVQIADGKAGTYRLDEGGNATAQTPCYWQNTNNANINAWYSNINRQATETNTDKIVSLSDQSKGLAYVLKATANDVSYNSQDIELKFHHQLAKVRVKLEGEKADDVTSVQVNNYTSCTVTNGNVSGNDAGYIQMRKNGDYYEANIVPMESITADNFILLNGKTKATISGISELNAGKVYTITLTVEKNAISDGANITEPGNYLMKGKYTETVTINCDGNVNLTLNEVTYNAYSSINVIKGNTTIIVKGRNEFNNSIITLGGENANITLDGQGSGILSFKRKNANIAAYNFSATIGGASGSKIGNIEIKDMTLHIDLSSKTSMSAAVIGSGECWGTYSSCGNITISNTDLTVIGGGCEITAAIIGTGMTYNNGTSKCGSITITLMQGQSKEQFLSKLDVTFLKLPDDYTPAEKVGKGAVAITTENDKSSCFIGDIKWLP